MLANKIITNIKTLEIPHYCVVPQMALDFFSLSAGLQSLDLNQRFLRSCVDVVMFCLACTPSPGLIGQVCASILDHAEKCPDPACSEILFLASASCQFHLDQYQTLQVLKNLRTASENRLPDPLFKLHTLKELLANYYWRAGKTSLVLQRISSTLPDNLQFRLVHGLTRSWLMECPESQRTDILPFILSKSAMFCETRQAVLIAGVGELMYIESEEYDVPSLLLSEAYCITDVWEQTGDFSAQNQKIIIEGMAQALKYLPPENDFTRRFSEAMDLAIQRLPETMRQSTQRVVLAARAAYFRAAPADLA